MTKTIIPILIIVLILGSLVLGFYFLFTFNNEEPEKVSEEDLIIGESKDDSEEKTPNKTTTNMIAVMKTNYGEIRIELFGSDAPNTVANFVKLIKEEFYNGTKFHRIVKGFMIQGGDPLSRDNSLINSWGTGGPGYEFNDEIHANNKNVIGTIAMANAGPNTNGSQFFINTADNNFLDAKHTVFGKVIYGMDVVSSIENIATGPQDRPMEDIIIGNITIE